MDGFVDPGETDPDNNDTDGDGLQDGTEMGVSVPIQDPDGDGPLLGTDSTVFQPDLDPLTTTNPRIQDTDGDGRNDGDEDPNHNGRVDFGETDPNGVSGDMDGDHAVTLADAIVAVKIAAGLNPGNVFLSGDVNGDGRIDSAELILILQEVSGLR